MKPETTDWVEKAEGDWKVALREAQAVEPVWDVICFLTQQCAEKYLKAFLEEQGIAFLKTHDLVVLLRAARELLPELAPEREQLAFLGAFGIAARYPGAEADRRAAENALETARKVRAAVRIKLGLS